MKCNWIFVIIALAAGWFAKGMMDKQRQQQEVQSGGRLGDVLDGFGDVANFVKNFRK